MKRLALLVTATLFVLQPELSVAQTLGASIPDSISVQGFLTDGDGIPLNGPQPVTFTFFKDDQSVYNAAFVALPVSNGHFDVILGTDGGLSTLSFNEPMEIEVFIDGEPLSPRIPLVAAPYALAVRGLNGYEDADGSFYSVNVIGGAPNNSIAELATGGAIGGGGGGIGSTSYANSVTGKWGTVSGGAQNTAELYGTVGGGISNTAGNRATVAGGETNQATGFRAAVGGGSANSSTGSYSVVSGGTGNVASGARATIPGGDRNEATGNASFAAGALARALHNGAVVFGGNSASSPTDFFSSTGEDQFLIRASGGVGIGTESPRALVTLAGPDSPHTGPVLHLTGSTSDQVESGRIRFVEGTAAYNYRGAYIRYDGSSSNRFHIGVHNTSDSLTANDQDIITIERNGGDLGIQNPNPSHVLEVGTDGTNGNGAHVTNGGAWTAGSSRSFKEDLRPVDPAEILDAVDELPLYRWRYKNSDEGDHLGPVAEDFFDAFELGEDERYISGVDGDGVALAAIQGLYALVKELQLENERMRLTLRRAGLD